MNQEDAIAIQALKARLAGTPMPAATQTAPQGTQAPQVAPMVPAQNPVPQPDHQLGTLTHKLPGTESDALAKAAMAGAAHTDPHVRTISKVLLERLIPYLGKGAPQPSQESGVQ